MKTWLIILFLSISIQQLMAQQEDLYIVKENGDTVIFELTAHEKEVMDEEKILLIRYKAKKRKKKIREYSSGRIAFYHTDTTYWVGFSKFFDEYFIALIARRKHIKKARYEAYDFEYRRIYYSEITYLETDGRNKSIIPRFLVGFAAGIGGFVHAIVSIGNNPALIPVGLATSALGFLILDPILTKEYHFKDWNYEIIEK